MTIPDLTNENRQPMFRRKRPAWLKWLMRIVIVICVFIAIALGVLSFVSGSSPELEESFEQRLSEIFQKKVTFERLNYVEVFPTVTIDVEGVIARPYTKIELARIFDANTQNESDPEEEAATPDITPEVETYYQEQDKTIVSADALLVKVSFFDIVFGFKKLKDINIQDLRIIPENPKEKLVVKRLELDPKAYLKDDGQRSPGLVTEGSYEGVDFSGQAALNVHLNANQNIVKYRFGDPSKFVVSYGPLSATGLFELQRSNTLSVDDFVLRHNQEAILNGHFRHIVATSKADRIVKGEIKIGGSDLEFNIQQVPFENVEDASLWKGELIAAPLQLDDITQEDTGFKLLLAGIDELKNMKAASFEKTADVTPKNSGDARDSAEPIEFTEPFFDINVNAKEIYGGDIALGQGQFHFLKTHDTYAAKDIIGTISKGDLSGHITLAKQDDQPQFNTRLEIRQLAYGDLQRAMTKESAVDGRADIVLHLSGAGDTQSQIRSSLQGRFSIISGEGEMESAAINNWGAGLVNALVPKKDDASELRLNCAVIDFDFDEGKGEAKTLFLDAKRTRVTGKGDIDLRDNTVDLVMKTNPKQVALLDMTPAVLVKGDLTNPSVSPSKLSLGKKIGGILLGTINPALLAVSLSDLGISEGHPCHESINKLEESMREDQPSAPKAETPAENTGNDLGEAQ